MRVPHVVIVGGGFGGLNAARELRRDPVHVTLIDRRNHHLFQPLLYQVATALLNPGDIAVPIRTVLRRQKNTEVLLAEVEAVDTERKRLVLRDGSLGYDFLIVATGSTHSYFGRDDWVHLAPGLKTIEDAIEIRRRVLVAFERAERERDPDRRREWLTFVIVGGGPTGVELAGAIVALARHALARDFRHVDPREARVILLEGVERVLSSFPPDLSKKATRQLLRLGVLVRTGARVTDVDERGVSLGSERIVARTTLWAAGVRASALARSLGTPLDRQGRVRVLPDLSLPGNPSVFVIGDLAAVTSGGKPVPGLAPAAIQEGRHAAANVRRLLARERTLPFVYSDRGNLATIGRGAGIGEIGRVHLTGWMAWLTWLLVHIFYLIGFRNRVLVLLQWTWAFFTYERGARIITGPIARPAAASERRAAG